MPEDTPPTPPHERSPTREGKAALRDDPAKAKDGPPRDMRLPEPPFSLGDEPPGDG